MEKARNECDHEEYGGETEEDNRPQDGCRRFIGEIQSSLRAEDREGWNWLRCGNTMGNIDENARASAGFGAIAGKRDADGTRSVCTIAHSCGESDSGRTKGNRRSFGSRFAR